MTKQTSRDNHNADHSSQESGPVIFGEVLFDCFPDGSRVLGGAPFNVAWHCQAFGLSPLFISRVGNDPLGFQIRHAMLEWGMDTSGLQLDSSHPTGIVDVTFRDGEPAYDIVANSAWDFIHSDAVPPYKSGKLLYHGSLALRNSTSAHTLERLKQNCSGSIFVDVNLRAPWWEKKQLEHAIEQRQWIKLNAEELSLLVPQKNTLEERIQYLLSTIGMELVIVTRGEQGALAVTVKGGQYSVKPEPATHVIDTVGAGDAFSSVLILGKIKNWSLQDSMQRAQNFASAIVGNRGATVQDKDFYQFFMKAWDL